MPASFLAYDVVDVFAESPFAGNQLAVVHGAADLSDAALLAIAREFDLSESTFPVPLASGRYRNRIFTSSGEIPFAGHPTLGTAWVLRERRDLAGEEVVQECGAGEIRVRFVDDLVELSAAPRDLAGPLPAAVVAPLLAELGLSTADLDGEAWVAGTGLGFVHLPVSDEAVVRAVVGRTHVRDLVDLPATGDPLDGINLYATDPGDPLEVHSRVFVLGIEDPATGSAAAGLGMALTARGLLAEGGAYRIRQGIELGRPSLLLGGVDVAAGVATRVRVSGQVHPIARGEIRVP
ncbi:MAG: phenazine biosynthesis protein PhzF family [Marmoricola sp.]|nr:phenazine biosynthesis protein PhzF family [Marmoricola sp.]